MCVCVCVGGGGGGGVGEECFMDLYTCTCRYTYLPVLCVGVNESVCVGGEGGCRS